MRKEILLGVFLLLALSLISIVSAGDVELEVITYANHDVTANIVNPVAQETIYSLVENSGANGKAIFNFSTSISRVDISIVVRKNGKIVTYEKFENYAPVGQISLRVLKDEDTTAPAPDTTTEDNQTAEVNDTTDAEVNDTSTTIPANTSEGENSEAEASTPPEYSTPLARIIFYTLLTIFLVFIILGIILFFIFRKRMASPEKIKVKKYSEFKKEEGKDYAPKTEDEKRLQELESKIKSLQTEIYDIKNRKSKIREAEEKLKKDMEELERLKKAAE